MIFKKKTVLLSLIFFLLVLPIVSATSPIGYEIYNQTTHIWNQGDIKQDYYYTGQCNHQLSNLPDEVWEKVILGMTYGNTAEELINNYVELHSGGCNRIEETDNQTYVNITVWKDITYLGESGRLAKNSYIELNDDYMRETFYFKAFDDINQDIWFSIKRKDIDISNNQKDDYIKVFNTDNTTSYLNLSAEGIYVRNQDQIHSGFYLMDYFTEEHIMFSTQTNADYKLIFNNGEVYFAVNAGSFSAGQSKKLATYWVDAGGCSCLPNTGGVWIQGEGVPATANVSEQDDFALRFYYIGANPKGCTGDALNWMDNTTGTFTTIPISDTDLDCSGVTCIISEVSENTWYNQTITWEGAGDYFLGGRWQCAKAFFSPSDTGIFPVEVLPPNAIIHLLSPINNYRISTNTNQSFLFNITSKINISNCSLYVNNTFVDINLSIINNSNNSIKYFLDNEGNYSWFVNCTLNDSTIFQSEETWYFFVHTYIYFYIFLFALAICLLILGLKSDEPIFKFLSGTLFIFSALAIANIGYPNFSNQFINTSSINILVGLGIYLVLISFLGGINKET
jgi:hypothetical protein